MIRRKNNILPMLCLLATVLLQGCVHGDMDDCPPMVNYAVAFEYTNHTGDDGDRFYDDVRKVNLYVFDDNGLVYTTTEKVSPYEPNFSIPLDLPMGSYRIIAWGNVFGEGDYGITPDSFVKGQTTFEEARLIFEKARQSIPADELDKLFYGEKEVEIPLYISKTDTVSLTNNTNNIRVVMHWDANDAAVQYDRLNLSFAGTSDQYDFNNNPMGGIVTYLPYRKTEGLMSNPYADQDGETMYVYYYDNDPGSYMQNFQETEFSVYDFSVLRLMPGMPLVLNLDYVNGDGTTSVNADIMDGLSQWLNSLGIYGTLAQQASYDKCGNYQVDIYVKVTSDGTYVAFTFQIRSWKKNSSGADGPGGYVGPRY